MRRHGAAIAYSGAAMIDLRLLGGFSINCGTAPGGTVRISSRKGRGLLAYLAMQPRHCESRERLANLLWGDRFDTQARHSLRQCLVQLRRELEPSSLDVLVIDSETVSLDRNQVAVDAHALASAVNSGESEYLKRAADLYRGEFLAGLTLDVEAFDTWAESERGKLAELAVRAFAASVDEAEACGDSARAIAMAERLVELDPLREKSQRLLLRMYALYRGRDAALALANRVAVTLRGELDVEPEAETATLIDAIKRGEIAPAQRTVALRDVPISAIVAAAAPDMAPPASDYLPHSVASRSGETTVAASIVAGPHEPAGRLRSRFMSVAGGTALAAALVLGVFAVPWRDLKRDLPNQPATAQTPPNAGDAEPADWRSPDIFPGVAVNQAELAAAHRQALVVLPFSSPDAADSATKVAAAEISDDLINDLSRAPTIRVISARTSRLYGGRPVDVAAIGAELGVPYVVEGSVRQEASRLRVNVALIDAKTRLEIWSDRFERETDERFSIQDEIVKGIARALHVAVIDTESRKGGRKRLAKSGNGILLARGWGAIFRSNETGGPGHARNFFEEVLRRDPGNPSALTGLAAHHVMTVAFELKPGRASHLDRAHDLLARVLEKEPRSSAAYYYLGLTLKLRGEFKAALDAFAKSIEINPSLAPAYANVGHVLTRMGRVAEAMDHIRYAIRLSPKDPALASWKMFGGQSELEGGNDQAAVEWLTRAVELSPRRPLARALLAAAHALNGDSAEAQRQVEELRKLVPSATDDAIMNSMPGGPAGMGPRFSRGLRLALARAS